jgi:hypothetical protein
VARFRHADGRNSVREFDGRLERHNGDVVDLNFEITAVKLMTVKSDWFVYLPLFLGHNFRE